jgi:SAM-dependent methyltransferase
MTSEQDYLLGTHDEEIERLGLQHRVWRPRALDAWRRAGFTAGQTLIDVGCGPGWASLDLAAIVGPTGRVHAMDRSRRFLDVLEVRARQQNLQQIEAHELDLDGGELPEAAADGAWVRWVFAFMKQPRRLLERLHVALRPGGVLALHEYMDYSTWRLAPRLPEIEEFVELVMQSWRADGGEPDIGLQLPGWLAELGFEIRELRPLVEVVPASNYVWQWPKAFIDVGVQRMQDLGRLSPERGRAILQAFAQAEARPTTLMITPLVLEVIATRL